MKRKILLFLLFVFSLATSVYAVDCEFEWTPSTESRLGGYKIYYNQTSGDKSTFVDVGVPPVIDSMARYTLSGLTGGVVYYFTITAYDVDGFESRHSSPEIAWMSPLGDAVFPGGVIGFGIPNADTMEPGDYKLTVNDDGSISISNFIDCPAQEECLIDSLGNLSSGVYELFVFADNSIDVVMIENSAPVVSIDYYPEDIIEGENIVVTATANDPEGDELYYTWYLDGEICGFDLSVNLANLSVGTHSLYVTVSDEHNTVSSQVVYINVLDGPHLSVTDVLVLTANFGDDVVVGSIDIRNTGNGNMHWDVSTTSGILSISPNSGINDGVVNVSADLFGLDPGEYYGDVVVVSSNAENSPRTIPVQVILLEDSLITTTVLVGPGDWSWNYGIPTYVGAVFNGDNGYSSDDNVYFQSVGDAFVVTEETRYINVRLYFENPSVLVLQMRNKSLSRKRWKRAMFSSFGDSWSSHSPFTGWFKEWGGNVDAQNEFLSLPTGFVEKSIDLTTNGFDIGDVCDGLAFSVHPSDPIVVFGDIILSNEPLYSSE